MVANPQISDLTETQLTESLAVHYMRLCDDLIIRLSLVNKSFQTIVVCGELPTKTMNDLRDRYPKSTITTSNDNQNVDLILDWGELHKDADPQKRLRTHYQRLNKGGLYIGGCWGNETLHSFQRLLIQADLTVHEKAYPRLFPFIRPNVMAQLLQQARFALPVVDWDRTHVQYKRVVDILRDVLAGDGVRLLGPKVNHAYINALESQFNTAKYPEIYYDWLWFHGWREH